MNVWAFGRLLRALFLLALSVALVVGCAAEPSLSPPLGAATVDKSPNDSRDYALIRLDNGLEVMLVSDPSVEKSAAALSVGLGAASDPDDYQGMAHYLEHMLFMGSARYPDPDGFMAFTSEHGGMSNAYTGLDITNYMMLIENDAFEEALDRFASFFIDPLLDPAYIEKEKNAVNAEWSMRREQDFRITYRLARKMLGDHPVNRFQSGNLESLADKTEGGLHAATVAFFEQFYSANLMKASLISPLPLAELAGLARQYFAAIPNKQAASPEITKPLNFEQIGSRLIRYQPKEDSRALRLEFLIENNTALFDTKPSEYLAYILSSEMQDTPAVRLRELGWASSLAVYADPSRYGNYGVFSFNVDLTPEGLAHRDDITEMLLGYIEMVRERGVDDRYATEFGTSLANRFQFLEKRDDFSYAHELTRAMQTYPAALAISAPFRFAGFDPEAVADVLAQLIPERLHVWYVDQAQPVSESLYFYDGQYSVESLSLPGPAQLVAVAEEYGFALPALNTLLPERFDVVETDGTPRQVVTEPGLSVWLQGSAAFAGLPRGYIQLYLNSPVRQHSADAAVMLALWADLYRLEQTALITEAGIAGMGLSMRADEGLRLSLSGFTDKQAELLSAGLAGLRVAPSEQQLDQALDRFLRDIENRKRDLPISQLGPMLGRLTQTGEYDDASLLQAAASVTLSRFEGFVDNLLQSALVRIYLFGNYDEAFATRLVDAVAASLPEDWSSSDEYVRARVYAPQADSRVVFNTDLPVEDLGMLYLFAAPQTSIADQAKGQILVRHLRNRAFDTLRTEEQLGYAAGGLAWMLQDQPLIGFYIQTPVKNPVDMLTRLDAFAVEYDAMLAEVTDEQFDNLKSGVLTQLTEPPKNLADEAGPYLADWDRANYAFDTRARLIAAVEAVTLEDIQDHYRETVLSQSSGRILLQLRGQRWLEAPFATLENATVIDSVEQFHAAMPLQLLD